MAGGTQRWFIHFMLIKTKSLINVQFCIDFNKSSETLHVAGNETDDAVKTTPVEEYWR